MFKLYQSYKYLFPNHPNEILETYEIKIRDVLNGGFSKANVSLNTVLLNASISDTVKHINA